MNTMKFITCVLIFGWTCSLSAQEDSRWDDVFTLGGMNGYVYATAVAPNGDIYVGGDFKLNNGKTVNHIARWDGENWHSLGAGTTDGWYEGGVRAIAIDGDNVYVGGGFFTAGDVPASNIAMWDGAEWHALGTGVNGPVTALDISNGNLYVGGIDITDAGGVTVKNVARWDGVSWHAMGEGLTRFNFVNAIAAHNDTVYAGGNFILSGTDTVNYVAMWDGSQWNDLGGGVDNTVMDVEFVDGILYVGGYFSQAGGLPAKCLAKWDGQQWSAFENGPSGSVYAIDVIGNDIYIGGQFQKVDTLQANRIARWDGETWHTFGDGLSFTVNTVVVSQERIFAGGDFERSGNTDLDYFAAWDGQSWATPGRMPDQSVDYGDVKAVAIDGNKVYVGGSFVKAGGDTVNRIAMWDGSSWHAMGGGVDNTVNTIVVDSGRVYVGGAFAYAGDLLVSRIAMWDGLQWNTLGGGMNNQVYAIAVKGKDVFAGGNFTKAGAAWAVHIARWDGNEWHALGGDGSLTGGGGLDGYSGSYVTSLQVEQDTLYIGGFFARAIYQGGSYVNVRSIAKWDGENWYGVAAFSNVTQQVIKSIVVQDARIYAAGSFPRVGAWPANRVVMWDGSAWNDIGGEFYNRSSSSYTLNALAMQDGVLYAAGACPLAGTDTVNYIARLEGENWVPLGSGLDDFVYAIAADSNYVYAGGRFKMAGNKGSSKIARYNVSGISIIENRSITAVNGFNLARNYPNPFNPHTAIEFTLPHPALTSLKVYNILGQTVATLVAQKLPAGQYKYTFDGSRLASGVYYYQLTAGKFVNVKKMILLR